MATLFYKCIQKYLPRTVQSSAELLGAFFISSSVQGTVRLKKACARKINNSLRNAIRLHQTVVNESFTSTQEIEYNALRNEGGLTFANFILYGEESKSAGGFFWSWLSIITGRLFHTEGIILPGRLLVYQTAQLVIGFAVSFGLYSSVEIAARAADQARNDLGPGLPPWVYNIVPTGRQVRIALYPASVVSAIVMFVLILIYIPRYKLSPNSYPRLRLSSDHSQPFVAPLYSAIGTVLQFRCGNILSLTSPRFFIYRSAVDTVRKICSQSIFDISED